MCRKCDYAFLTYERAGSAQVFKKWRAKVVAPPAPCSLCRGSGRIRSPLGGGEFMELDCGCSTEQQARER